MRKKAEHAKHVTTKTSGDSGIFNTLLMVRLVIATVIFAVSLVIKMPDVVSVILLALAAVIAGYDIIIEAVNAVEAKDYFATPMVVVVIAVLSYVIGFGIEGAALIILYQIGLLLLGYVEDRTKRTALDLLKYQDEETSDRVKYNLDSADSCSLELEEIMRDSSGKILKLAMIIAVVYAVVIPLVTSYSYTVSIHRALTIILISTPVSVVVSIPLAAYVAMCYSAQEGVVFNDAATMERAERSNIAVFDKSGIFSSGTPRVVSAHSDVLDNDTFMDFIAHSVYYSEQPIAKAVAAMGDQDYKLDVISDFEEIPGRGVKLKVGGADVVLASGDYFSRRGVHVPEITAAEGIPYYLTISERYIGYIVLVSEINTEYVGLTEELGACGIGRSILLTEDSTVESQRIAEELVFKEVYGELNTDGKLQFISDLNEGNRNRVMYVYSDSAEAHSAAQVDIRVGRKSRYADAIVVPESIANIPFAMQVCRRMREVATVNAVFAFLVKAILIFLSIVGYCNIWFAIFIDMIAAIATMLATIRVTQNSLINTYKFKTGRS